jgi:hypothetical protein
MYKGERMYKGRGTFLTLQIETFTGAASAWAGGGVVQTCTNNALIVMALTVKGRSIVTP